MQPPAQPIKLYRFRLSGHCHRVELFLSLLGLPCQLIDIDLPGKQQKSPQFLALNPFGQVPVIDDNGVVLADSNAILVYLALRYGEEGWLPRDPSGAAAVQRWLSVAAGPLAFGPAAARVARMYKRPHNAEAMDRAHALLAVMEQELSTQDFLAGPRATLADIANYTYIAHAPEGGVMLDTYPLVQAWLKRIEALPGYIAMQPLPA
jgi:glutathione S-transferase